MKFLSIYKSVERGVPPTQEEMAKMGKLIEQGMKAGTLLATDAAVETSWPSLSFALDGFKRVGLHSITFSETQVVKTRLPPISTSKSQNSAVL